VNESLNASHGKNSVPKLKHGTSMANRVRQILSGMQPTGVPTLGNYIGFIRSSVWLQQQMMGCAEEFAGSGGSEVSQASESYSAVPEADLAGDQQVLDQWGSNSKGFWERAKRTDGHRMFFLADLHALTSAQDPEVLGHNIMDSAASLIACGLDPQKSVLFQQSLVKQHTELTWLLQCQTSLGWLNRMTQFKEKASGDKDGELLGLYAYPALMAADILLYNATHVPVGDDQAQHLELTRLLVTRMNHRYKMDLFRIPDAIYPEGGASRIRNLKNPHKKMSKSESSQNSKILLTDTDDLIARKIRKAATDAFGTIKYTDHKGERPGVFNLLTILACMRGVSVERTHKDFEGKNLSTLKEEVVDALIDHVGPIRQEIERLQNDPSFICKILEEGALKASEIAEITMEDVRDVVGLNLRKSL